MSVITFLSPVELTTVQQTKLAKISATHCKTQVLCPVPAGAVDSDGNVGFSVAAYFNKKGNLVDACRGVIAAKGRITWSA